VKGIKKNSIPVGWPCERPLNCGSEWRGLGPPAALDVGSRSAGRRELVPPGLPPSAAHGLELLELADESGIRGLDALDAFNDGLALGEEPCDGEGHGDAVVSE